MKLELKHLACYLPHRLKYTDGERTAEMVELSISEAVCLDESIGIVRIPLSSDVAKPILRPLSDLTKEIEHNGERFVPVEIFEIGDEGGFVYEFTSGNIKTIQQLKTLAKYNNGSDINYMPFALVQMLIEWHFDVFGLIDAGMAIDINTLQS